MAKKKILNSITFIGDGLADKRVVSESCYLKKIINFADNNSKKVIYYYPHRCEKIIFRNLTKLPSNIKIMKNKYNIELDLVNSNYISNYYVSFYSSALLSIKKLLSDQYKVKFKYISFEKNDLNKEHYPFILNLIKTFSKEKIKLIS